MSDEIRGEYAFQCCEHDCHQQFRCDDLARIARRAARHLNKEHSRLLSNYETIETVEYGGHHITDNAYEVRKYDAKLTSFDVMDRIGQIDGWVVPADGELVCEGCLHEIPDEEHRIEEDPDDPFNDDWTCAACLEEADVERRESENQDITEWVQ